MTSDPSPWVVLAGGAASLVAVWAAFRRPVLWLWHRNVTEPFIAKADEIVTTVVKRELKERNGGASLVDLADQNRANHLAIIALETTMHAHQARLQEVGRKADEARKATDAAAAHTQELVVELTAVNDAARNGLIDRRRDT